MLRTVKKIPLSVQTVIGLALGVIAGLWIGRDVPALGLVGKTIIQLVKTFATPLLFFAIFESILTAKFRGKGVMLMLGISLFNGAIAATIGMLISNIFRPGELLQHTQRISGDAGKLDSGKLDLIGGMFGHIPESVVGPFGANSIPGVIFLSVLFGLSLSKIRRDEELKSLHHAVDRVTEFVSLFYQMNLKVMTWVIYLVPLAVFAVVTKTVGQYGFSTMKGLGAYLLAGVSGMALQIFIVYQLWILFSRVRLFTFWKEAKTAIFYSLGVNSSLATLPLTLKALNEMKVSRESARLSACVGTNFNNDGILLYEAMAVLFVAQASGVELTVAQQFLAAGVCAVAAFGVAGVPEAGVVGLSLVLSTIGLPLEILPLLLTVDWVLARCRSATNVISDMTVAVAIDGLAENPAKS